MDDGSGSRYPADGRGVIHLNQAAQIGAHLNPAPAPVSTRGLTTRGRRRGGGAPCARGRKNGGKFPPFPLAGGPCARGRKASPGRSVPGGRPSPAGASLRLAEAERVQRPPNRDGPHNGREPESAPQLYNRERARIRPRSDDRPAGAWYGQATCKPSPARLQAMSRAQAGPRLETACSRRREPEDTSKQRGGPQIGRVRGRGIRPGGVVASARR